MQEEIMQLLNSRGGQTAAILAKSLKVSPKTVRKNLKPLVESGAVERLSDGTFMVKGIQPAKAVKAAKADSVEAMVESNAAEVNKAISTPRTKSGAPKAERIMGCRVGTKNAVAAKLLLEKGTLQQVEIGKIVGHSTDWINWLVKKGYVTFDKKTRTVTLTKEGKAA